LTKESLYALPNSTHDKITYTNEQQWKSVFDRSIHFLNSLVVISHARWAYYTTTMMLVDYRHNTQSGKYLPTYLNGYLAYQEMFQVNLAYFTQTVLYQA
jgi:hypothetical protein